jgi:hypothetical protein
MTDYHGGLKDHPEILPSNDEKADYGCIFLYGSQKNER